MFHNTYYSYRKGERIPTVSQGIWQVRKGVVQLSTLYTNGEEGLLGWVGPSMCFSLWLTDLQIYQAKALSDVHLIWFSIREVEGCPELTREILPQLSRRLRQTEAMLAIAGLRRVEDRLQQLLLLLGQEIGKPEARGIRITVHLTHQDIARAINASRVTVTRMLGKLRSCGAIAIDKHQMILKDGYWSRANYDSVLRSA